MTKEVLDILNKVEDKILILPFEKESDSIEVEGVKFTHQELMSDIY